MSRHETQDDFSALFAPEPSCLEPSMTPDRPPCKVLIVDDEPDIHAVFRLELQRFQLAGGSLLQLDAHSAAAARSVLAEHPDVALILLDVVMESERAGLELVEYIRRQLGNRLVQIVLITGQPGYAPERAVVADYEIQGYYLKTELTSDRLFSLVSTALRTYKTLCDQHRESTKLRLAQDELKRERTLKEAIIESSNDAIIAKSLDGTITSWNQGAERIFGYSAEEMLGKPMLIIIPSDRQEEEARVIAAIRSGIPIQHYETQRSCKDGHLVPVSITVSPIRDQEGRIVGASKIARDITAQKQAEEENARLQSQLMQAQKMESLGVLSGGIAHDMNNVLGAILGLASANLEVQVAGTPTYRSFETILKAATRGGEMVRSLLAFARQSNAEERVLDLNAILREDLLLLEHTTLAKVQLQVDLEPGLHAMRGDPSALTHAFMNLCVNAVDAMPERGSLTLRTRNLGRNWIEVTVEDTGCGMPEAVLKRAMEPFFTTKEIGRGTGLGLAMVHSTVKAHRGQLEIHSTPGQGTQVRMRFPACEAAAEADQAPAEARPETTKRVLRVLLVDDDELIQVSVQSILQTLGHEVDTTSCGEEALARIEAGLRPDLVILDLNMPGLGGRGTLPRLRALLPAVPVLLSTGRADQAALDLVKTHPNVTLLAKPFNIKELQQYLGNCQPD
jgi:PAS domain S-box-containing protein